MLEQIARHLAFCGLGTVDVDIFWGRMPDMPDECLCVYSSDSGVPGKDEGSRVQIVNRSRTPGEAYEKACQVAEALDGMRGFLAGDGAMAQLRVNSSAVGLGADARKREMYAANVTVYSCL